MIEHERNAGMQKAAKSEGAHAHVLVDLLVARLVASDVPISLLTRASHIPIQGVLTRTPQVLEIRARRRCLER